jgi:four helix bundle protein
MRRSSKSVKDQIAEGYGRRRYKLEYIKFLIYSQSSCDEVSSQIEMVIELYPALNEFPDLLTEYNDLGRRINTYIKYVESNWKS